MQLYSGVPGVDDLAAELAAAADVPAGQRPHKGYGLIKTDMDVCERARGSHGPRLRGGNIGWRGRWRVATNTPDTAR